MDKEQILALAKKTGLYDYQPQVSVMKDFANAAIESYKAELLKEAGEPVSYLHKEFSWKNRQSECVVKMTLKAQPEYGFTTPLYTSDQLAAAQELIAVLRKDAETYGPEKISLQKQAWLEADRQQQINDLKDQLAKAEQRVAEACALQVATETRFHWLDAARVAKEIRSGEWRKFVKGV